MRYLVVAIFAPLVLWVLALVFGRHTHAACEGASEIPCGHAIVTRRGR